MPQIFARRSRTPLALAAAAVAASLLLGCNDADDGPAVEPAPQQGVLSQSDAGRAGGMLADAAGGSPAVGDAMRISAQDGPAGPAMVNADSLKRRAIDLLKKGEFDETEVLLARALELRPDDPSLRQMDAWVEGFQEQRDRFAEERAEAFDRQVRDVRLLQENGYRSYAINATRNAHLLAADADAFAAEPWVQELIQESAALGEQYEADGEWLRAMRVWGDLASLETLDPRWKNELEGATRRVRLLATYAPEILEEIRDSTQAERDAVDALLASDREPGQDIGDPPDDPSVEDGEAKDGVDPATKPSADAADGLDESFKTDWHNALEGITMTMLRNALDDAREGYVRPVELKAMLLGGIEALRAVATTPGLERAFPSLEDEAAVDAFLAELDKQRDQVEASEAEAIDRAATANLLRAVAVANDRGLDLPEAVLVSEFADGALGELDPFTSMIWPSQVAEFKKGTQGEFVGVGIQIRSEDTGELRVVSPLPGGPAEESGIRYGDVITHIDGKSANGISDAQAVEVITGQPGTEVTLTVRSVDGSVGDHTLVRRQINVSSVKGWLQNLDQGGDDGAGGGWQYLIDPVAGVGYVRINNFQATTADELGRALDALRREGARAIILDLRYNPGGLLQSAVEVADRFVAGGKVVSTRGERPGARESSLRAGRQAGDVLGVPMVVLVNEYSASASEIVSGALKDLGRALVVGKRTFGKGSVQMLYRLGGRGGDEAWLKLTTSHYYLPSGKNIHKEEFDTEWGVEPDVPVEMTPKQMLDAQLARQSLDVIRDDGTTATVKRPAEDGAEGEEIEVDAREALLETDAQLSAALLLLRMQLAGEAVM